jgi:hypothetical protein
MRMGLSFWRTAGLLGSAAALATAAVADLPKPGKTAPAWNGKTVAGKALSSNQLKGKVVLMNFFGFT